MAERDFDFIICGGGSAASVAAMRLVRDFGFSVLMLERGPRSTNPIMAMPAGYMKYLGRDTYLEMHHTVPQPQLGGRGFADEPNAGEIRDDPRRPALPRRRHPHDVDDEAKCGEVKRQYS